MGLAPAKVAAAAAEEFSWGGGEGMWGIGGDEEVDDTWDGGGVGI